MSSTRRHPPRKGEGTHNAAAHSIDRPTIARQRGAKPSRPGRTHHAGEGQEGGAAGAAQGRSRSAVGWGRHLPAWGTMGVDFESRVEFDRMRRYRIARARQALENSDLGALLLFDVNNIRYVSATKIGEWERDKLARFALLAKGQEPIVWDFGSAAVHHQLYSPWLLKEHCKAGLVGLRGTVPPSFGLMKYHAEEIASLLRDAGVAQDAGRRRHHRAADDVRAGEGGPEDPGRPAGDAGGARDQEHRRDRAADARRRHGRRRLSPDLRRAEAGREGDRRSSPTPTASSTRTAPTTWRRSTRSPASAATRIRTTSPTA